jgi:hypothetical protein
VADVKKKYGKKGAFAGWHMNMEDDDQDENPVTINRG